MEDTVKAKVGYRVRFYRNGFNELTSITDRGDNVLVYDGNKPLYLAQLRSLDDYKDECENGNNECAVKYEVFTTIKGIQFIYWGDTETGEDFITRLAVGDV